MLRACVWKTWKKVKTRFINLQELGISKDKAWEYANTRKGYWRISNSPLFGLFNLDIYQILGYNREYTRLNSKGEERCRNL